MNAQQLEYVRIQLRAALVDDSGGTKGQLEAFAENPPADKDRNPRKPVHVVELEDGRQVQAENSALYVLETRSRRRPMPPIRDRAFSLCAWRRAVLTLDDSQQAWIKYCYGFDLHFAYQREICRFIWENYLKQQGEVKLQKRVEKRLIQLVWLAVQEVVARNTNETYKDYAATTLANFLSINRDTWYDTYASPWREFKGLATDLDRSALYRVGSQLMSDGETV
jgi:hypothetical protein